MFPLDFVSFTIPVHNFFYFIFRSDAQLNPLANNLLQLCSIINVDVLLLPCNIVTILSLNFVLFIIFIKNLFVVHDITLS